MQEKLVEILADEWLGNWLKWPKNSWQKKFKVKEPKLILQHNNKI